MRRPHVPLAILALVASLHAIGCAGAAEDDDTTSDESDELRGDAKDIDIGFDGAAGGFGVDQFQYFPLFFGESKVNTGPRLCHTYVTWDLANQAEAMGNAQSPAGRRPAFEYWLQHAQTDGHCDEVLISFKDDAVDGKGNPVPGALCANGTKPPCDAPTQKQMHDAFARFVQTDWKKLTGYAGAFAFTPWNEPDNPGGPGNGLGKVIPPERAAEFYLTLANLCNVHGCKVAAGDFASNGSWPKDFEWNCANDTVANMTVTHKDGSRWCKTPSSYNPGNKLPASYLDIYKDTIALHAKNYPNLAANHRPKYFAFHGWHDANQYVNFGDHAGSYATSVTRRLLKSLGGSWGGADIWDTEVGVSQGDPILDEDQACGAAFLLRLTTVSRRIKRIYYTRMHGGGGELVEGNDPKTATKRAALKVLAQRQTQHGGSCR